MKRPAENLLNKQISSNLVISLTALLCGFGVLAVALGLQWLVYDDWLHTRGPLQLVGSLLAGLLAFLFALRGLAAARERKREMLRRLETIASMNDRIRNALQVIECATYATNPGATAPVRNAVDVIESVLKEFLEETHPPLSVLAQGSGQEQERQPEISAR